MSRKPGIGSINRNILECKDGRLQRPELLSAKY